jgi:hypothetical protein
MICLCCSEYKQKCAPRVKPFLIPFQATSRISIFSGFAFSDFGIVILSTPFLYAASVLLEIDSHPFRFPGKEEPYTGREAERFFVYGPAVL